MGTYCIFVRVVKAGRGLLEGCCIVYLATGGGYCIFRIKNLYKFDEFF